MAVNRQTYTDDGKKTNSGKPKTETQSVTVGGRSVNVSVPTPKQPTTPKTTSKSSNTSNVTVGGRTLSQSQKEDKTVSNAIKNTASKVVNNAKAKVQQDNKTFAEQAKPSRQPEVWDTQTFKSDYTVQDVNRLDNKLKDYENTIGSTIVNTENVSQLNVQQREQAKEYVKTYNEYNTAKTGVAIDKMEEDANKEGKYSVKDVAFRNNEGKIELYNYFKELQDKQAEKQEIETQLKSLNDERKTYGNGMVDATVIANVNNRQSQINERLRAITAEIKELTDKSNYQKAFLGKLEFDTAIENNDQETLDTLFREFESYDDTFTERRTKNMAKIGVDMAGAIASTIDIARDLGGELLADNMKRSAKNLLDNGEISDDQYNEMITQAKALAEFDATADDNVSTILRNESARLAYEIQNGEDGIARFIGEGLDSTANFLTQFLLLRESGSLAMMATQSGTQKYFENLEKGYSQGVSLLNAVATGLTSYFTEKIGMDNFVSTLNGTANQNIFGQVLSKVMNGESNLSILANTIASQGLAEGLEEAVEGNVDYILDSATAKFFNGEPVEYNAGDIFYGMLVGAFSGALMGAGGGTYNLIVNTRSQYNTLKNDLQSALEIANEARIKGETVTPELMNAISKAELALNNFEAISQTMGVTTAEDMAVRNDSLQETKQLLGEAITPNVENAYENVVEKDVLIERINQATNDFLSMRGVNMDSDQFIEMTEQDRADLLKKAPKINEAFPNARLAYATHYDVDGVDVMANSNAMVIKMDGGTPLIVVNPKGQTSVLVSAIHEAIHTIEGTEEYKNIHDTLFPTAKSELNKINELLADRYKGERLTAVDKEAVAITITEDMMKDEGADAFIEHLAKYNTSFAYKMLYNFRDALNLFKDDKLTTIERKLTSALSKQDTVYMPDGMEFSVMTRPKNLMSNFLDVVGKGKFIETPNRLYGFPLINITRDENLNLRFNQPQWAIDLGFGNYPHLIERTAIKNTQYDSDDPSTFVYKSSHHQGLSGEQNTLNAKKNPISRTIVTNLDLFYQKPFAVFYGKNGSYLVTLKATDSKGYPIIVPVYPPEAVIANDKSGRDDGRRVYHTADLELDVIPNGMTASKVNLGKSVYGKNNVANIKNFLNRFDLAWSEGGISKTDALNVIRNMQINAKDGSYFDPSMLKDVTKSEMFYILEKADYNDGYHKSMQNPSDVFTFDEVISNPDDIIFTEDYTKKDLQNVLDTGKIKVYYKGHLKTGMFVTPSISEARRYAIDDTLYSTILSPTDVAWNDSLEGQFVKKDFTIKFSKMSNTDSDENSLTQQQASYFAMSKARDMLGRLKRFYHGTYSENFTIFDPKKTSFELSFFFTDNPKIASTYVGGLKNEEEISIYAPETRDNQTVPPKNRIYSVYLNLENPLIVYCEGRDWLDLRTSLLNERAREYNYFKTADDYNRMLNDYADVFPENDNKYEVRDIDGRLMLGKINPKGEWQQLVNATDAYIPRPKYLFDYLNSASGFNFFTQFYTTVRNNEDSYRRTISTDEVAEWAHENGYDGVIFEDIIDSNSRKVRMPSTVGVAFESNQIKSTRNEFPTSHPDITFSRMSREAGIKSDVLDTQVEKQNVETPESKAIGTHLRDFDGVDLSTISTDDLYDEALKLMDSDDENDLANSSRRLQEIIRRYRYLYNGGPSHYMFNLDAFDKFPEISTIMDMGNRIADKFPRTYSEDTPFEEFLSDPQNKARYDQIVRDWKEKFVKDEYLAKDGEKPTLTIVMGLPGAGKSVALKGEKLLVLDNDDIKQLHPLFKKYKGIVSGAIHEESSSIMNDISRELYGDENLTVDEMKRRGMPVYNIAIPKIFGHHNEIKLQREIDKARKKGYNVSVKLVDISSNDSHVRNAGRYAGELGRLIPKEAIIGYGDNPYKNFVSVLGKEENNDVTFKRYENGAEVGLLRTGESNEAPYTDGTEEGNGRRGTQQSPLSSERTGSGRLLPEARSGIDGNVPERGRNNAVNESKGSFSNIQFSRGSNDISTNVDTEVQNVRHVDGEVTDGYAERKKQQFRENNLEKSTVLDEKQKERTREMSAEGYFSYQSYINKVEVQRAKEYMERDGIDKTFTDYMATNDISMKNVVKGEVLLTELAKNNDPRWEEVATKLADDSTVAGQTLQAYAILQRLSPSNQLVAVDRSLRRMQTQLDNKYGNKAPTLEVPPELREELRTAKTAEEAQEARDKIMESLLKQHPLTWSDIFDSWRYLAMLGNPRTHVRNLLGNVAFMPAVGLKNAIGTVIENALSDKLSYKTKAFVSRFNESDRILYNAGVEAFKEQRALQEKNKKYEQRGFGEKHKILNAINQGNSWLLEAEDMLFSQDRYALSYAQYLKANDLTPDKMTAEQKVRANQYAYAESLKATYRDANDIANWLNELEKTNKKGLKTISFFKKAILPFTRTPFNIVKRGMEYSGIGLLRSIYDGVTAVRNGTMDINTWIDELSAGLSGTAIMGLGWLLSKMGIFRTKDDDKDRKKYFDQGIGEQDYSIDLGNGTYTLDWMSPVIMPLAMGAEFANAFTDIEQIENADSLLNAFLNIASNLADPIVETSMLSSLKDAMSSYANEGSEYFGDVITSAIASYIGQLFPTVFGQLARTVDDTRRATSPNKGLIDKTVKQILNKMPYIDIDALPSSKWNQPYINKKGQEEKTEDLGMGALGRFILNTLSPGYYSSKDADKYDMEMLRLYEDSGQIDALPSSTTKSVTFNKENMKFSDKEYTEWHKTRWSTESEYVNQFMDSKTYNSLSDEERVATIKDIRKYAQEVAKKQFLESKGYIYTDNEELAKKQPDKYIYEKGLVNAEGALDSGVELYAYYDYLNNAGTKQADKLRYLEDSGLTKKQKDYLWGLSDYKTSYEDVYKKVFGGTDNSSSKKKKSSSRSKNGSSKSSGKITGGSAGGISKAKGGGTISKLKASPMATNPVSDTRIANNFFKAYANTFKRGSKNVSSASGNTIVCPRCGNRVSANMSRCPICGASL